MVTSLKRARSPRTVLLRMAADQERAERLKAIKIERPDLTWPQLAEACGVTERSVAAWAATGSMSRENAKKAAEFLDVDLEWLWRGPPQASPDLMSALAQPDVRDQLDRIESRLNCLATALEDGASRALAGDPIQGLEDLVQQLRADTPPESPEEPDAPASTGR